MAKLHVIRASAGSGKTYTLTEEYLKLALRDAESFRHILAVTFTNKATAEMKTRLIRELFRLSSGQPSHHMEQLTSSLGLTEPALRSRAASVLQKILHTYSRFSVGTIDSFFQQIIRSFTREMGIQSGYTVELDTESVLDDAIDRLQAETSLNKHLLRWLTDFALDKIDKGSSWNFRKDIAKLGRQLFNEQFKTFSNALSDQIADKDFMIACQQEFAGIKKKFEHAIQQMANGGMERIRAAGLETGDFFQRDNGPAGFLQKVSAGMLSAPNSYVRKATEASSGWYSKSSARREEIEKACHDGLLSVLRDMVAFYDRESRDYFTAEQILKNLYALGILTDLSGHLQDYCRENNVFLLSEASYFLNQVIDNNDAPFVYEKTGNHFHHFMIDEFQDTSLLQWNNFKPLISNSLSQHYDNLIVGDVKQSIYRWRNSNWEILAHAVADEFYHQSLDYRTLKYNHRSCINIIRFNNTVFREASCLVQDHFDRQSRDAGISLPGQLNGAATRNFTDATQMPGQADRQEGMVRISFLDKEDYGTEMKKQLLELINGLFEKGFTAGDMAILTRKNEEAKDITDFFLSLKKSTEPVRYPFDVISDETLYLSNSHAVCFLVGIIRYLYAPEDLINKYFIVSEFTRYLLPDEEGRTFVPLLESPDFSDVSIDPLFPEAFRHLKANAGNHSLFELTENLISLFRLHETEGEAVYLQAFQDMILDFVHRKSSSVSDFLECWDERGFKKPVILPGNQNAIRVLTIHKAKGLEFPVVIVPYCSWKLADQLSRPLLWCKAGHPPFNKLRALPVEFTSKLSQTHFAVDYFEELLKQYIDALNLLYVTFTRASTAVFCFAPLPGKDQLANVSDLLLKTITGTANQDGQQDTVTLNQYYRSADHVFELGSISGNASGRTSNESPTLLMTQYPVANAGDHLKIAFQGRISAGDQAGDISRPVSEGSLMHDIFSRIFQPDDIPRVMDKMVLEGRISDSRAAELNSFIRGLFDDAQVSNWFSGEWKAMTETEFVLPGGHVKRPDRVLTRDDRAVIIDYKFGRSTDERHKKQLQEYRSLLQVMGYTQAEAWLWYVMLNKKVRVE